MSAATWAGILLVIVPIAFNVAFAMLAAKFEYPEILRRPTSEVLAKFREGGSGLILLWWSFAMTAVFLIPLVVLFSNALVGANSDLLAVATVVGLIAALVQLLGLIRWPMLVPYLARADQDASPARSEAVDVVFQSFNRYLGVGVGEHLGYLFTGIWSVLIGIASTESSAQPTWLGIVGIVAGAALIVCSFEFVGRSGDHGWKVAETLTPIAYVIWSLWLIASGVAFLI
jgi:hypothetical protein